MKSLENSNIPRNIDIPWNIGGILGDSPEYWGEPGNIELNTLTKYSTEYDLEYSIIDCLK